MQVIKFDFETDFIDKTTNNLIVCSVEAKAILDKNYGADRDGNRGSLELADLDLKVKLRSPINSTLEKFDSFPLLQKAIYNHCRDIAKERALELRMY